MLSVEKKRKKTAINMDVKNWMFDKCRYRPHQNQI